MTGAEVRSSFLEFFRERSHRIVPSDRIVPANDPSILFTNAGMVQFKNVFLGTETPLAPRIADSQKCLRISGKHNDLDDVGRDIYHQTFFEMLGNWSFGDYYKAEAIEWAWDLLTRVWGLDKKRLYATVFRTDEDAAALWPRLTDLPAGHVLPFDEKDNFWEMGETGPCGPCSELHYDRGPGTCDLPTGHVCGVNSGCARYMEIWNLVFIQNDRQVDRSLADLPSKHVDTGMGLERVTALLQGVNGNYDSDLLRSMITVAEERAGRGYRGGYSAEDIAFRVIADHARAVAVMIGDGILPSNDGRGYVLRRLLRRAARQGRLLGMTEPFLGAITDNVVDVLGSAHPELFEARARIRATVTGEEERFGETLEKGLGLLSDEVSTLTSRGETVLAGATAFRLYDTYGFPVDLTADILRGESMTVDREGFDLAMGAQRDRARAGARFQSVTGGGLGDAQSRFVGDRLNEFESPIVALSVAGEERSEAREGEEIDLVVAETPFYGESGGQSGDCGMIEFADGSLVEIFDTQKPRPDLIVHRGRVVRGSLRVGAVAQLRIDAARREAIRLNHSATHILHAVLRERFGAAVHQAGSSVTAERLRFDFTQDSRIDEAELGRIEDQVNVFIRSNAKVIAEEMSFDEAIAAGALAFFGDKYGDRVRMLRMGEFSTELCGGSHVSRTGDIGLFKLRGESAVGAGVRRIEALTGEGALQQVQRRERELRQVADLLRCGEEDLAGRIEKLLVQQRELERSLAEARSKLASVEAEDLLAGVREVGGVKVLVRRLEEIDAKVLRTLADSLRDRLGSGVVVLGGTAEGKVLLLAAVTKDLLGRVQAGSLVRELAPMVGGAGGGRPDFAQAGGRDPARLDEALERVYALVAG